MKGKTKFLKTFISLVLLMFAVFGAVNISYSFFTSANSTQGSISMGDMIVSFRFKAEGIPAEELAKGSSITLISSDLFIERGVPFNLKLEDGGNYYNMQELSIIKKSGSCDAYVRFWVEAYRMVGNSPDLSVDYGKYFFLTRPPTVGKVNNFSRATTEPYCYYIEQALYDDEKDPSTSVLSLGNEMTLKDITKPDPSDPNKEIVVNPVPIDLLGERIQIRLSFEAVQKANEAFKTVFAVTETDQKGYYSKWT